VSAKFSIMSPPVQVGPYLCRDERQSDGPTRAKVKTVNTSTIESQPGLPHAKHNTHNPSTPPTSTECPPFAFSPTHDTVVRCCSPFSRRLPPFPSGHLNSPPFPSPPVFANPASYHAQSRSTAAGTLRGPKFLLPRTGWDKISKSHRYEGLTASLTT